MKKKIIIMVGTRPEAIKLIPVYVALKGNPHFDARLISTGQHKEMLAQIFAFFQITPDRELSLMKANQSLAQITALLFQHLDDVIVEEQPHLVMVQGDTTTAMVASMTAFYRRIPIAHVEAGLRSHDKWAPFPEEVNRKIISQVGDIHFAPTERAAENLRREATPGVYVVGNTVVDALLMARQKVQDQVDAYEKKFAPLIDRTKKLILLTIHRREVFGDALENICVAIRELAQTHPDCQFVFPVHLNPHVQQAVRSILSDLPRVHLLAPLQYDDLIYVMMQSFMILTDSGGIQEEAPSFDVPLVVLRDVTERPEGIEAGCARLGGTSPQTILENFRQIYSDPALYKKMQQVPNPYGDGLTSQRISRILTDELISASV